MSHARGLGVMIAAIALVLAGCASRSPAAAHHLRAAPSVKSAALGYYRSAADVDSRLRFACATSGRGTQIEYTVTGVVTAPSAVAASVERSRSAWIVSLKRTGDVLPFARYRVLKSATGYCVDRALGN